MNNDTNVKRKEFYPASEICGNVANKTDTLSKVVSVALSIIELVGGVLAQLTGFEGVKEGLSALLPQLKYTKGVINVFSIFGRAYEWSDPEERAKCTSTWYKTANKVALTAGCTLETVGFVDQLTVGFFSQPALSIGGVLPIFTVVKNSFYLISSIFGLVGSAIDLEKAKDDIKHAEKKEAKWARRNAQFESEITFEEFNLIKERYKNKCDKSVQCGTQETENGSRYKAYYQSLGGDTEIGEEAFDDCLKNFRQLKIQRLLDKNEEDKSLLPIFEKKLAEVKGQEYLREEMPVKTFQDYLNYKIEKSKIKHENADKLFTKSWLGIAAEVGKIFMITVGMLIAGLSLIFPVLTLPVVVLTLTAIGLVSNAFGLVKTLYSDVFAKEIKGEPVFINKQPVTALN